MKTTNNHSLCKQAELYYYDFLSEERNGLVPKNIIEHINQCPFCRENIDQLDTGLSSHSSIKSRTGLDTAAITDLLTLHLAYIGNKVNCQAVKPFLPVLLYQDFRIKIPTPITVHLDHCHQCAQDLETIANLNLSRTQSCRLSQLLADKKAKNSVRCSQIQAAIPAAAALNFQQMNVRVLKHICSCNNCREALYEHRQKTLKEHSHDKGRQECAVCKQLSTSDIFDYVVPYGLDPAQKQNSASTETAGTHLANCPTALAKIQKLHRLIYKIAERDDSETITIYKINEFAETKQFGETEDLYSGHPIKVEVEQANDKQKAAAISYSAALKRKISALHVSPAIKIGFVAVAVFLIGVTLFFRPTAAGALTIRQIYTAIDQVRNVYISTFAGQPTPIQEQWISRSFDVSILKTTEDWHLINFTTKQRKTKTAGPGSIEVTQLSDEIIADFQYQNRGSLGLMPYDQISGIPSDAKWNHLNDNEPATSVENMEIYELTWLADNYGGLPVFNKWLFTIDSQTKLPHKIECYRKLDADDQYAPTSIIVIEYPDDEAMQAVIDSF